MSHLWHSHGVPKVPPLIKPCSLKGAVATQRFSYQKIFLPISGISDGGPVLSASAWGLIILQKHGVLLNGSSYVIQRMYKQVIFFQNLLGKHSKLGKLY